MVSNCIWAQTWIWAQYKVYMLDDKNMVVFYTETEVGHLYDLVLFQLLCILLCWREMTFHSPYNE